MEGKMEEKIQSAETSGASNTASTGLEFSGPSEKEGGVEPGVGVAQVESSDPVRPNLLKDKNPLVRVPKLER